jgi:hypothetical protein
VEFIRVKSEKLDIIAQVSLILNMDLGFRQVGDSALHESDILLKVALALDSLLVQLAHKLSLLGIHSHPELLKHRAHLMLESLVHL